MSARGRDTRKLRSTRSARSRSEPPLLSTHRRRRMSPCLVAAMSPRRSRTSKPASPVRSLPLSADIGNGPLRPNRWDVGPPLATSSSSRLASAPGLGRPVSTSVGRVRLTAVSPWPSERLHRVQVDVIGDRLAHLIADRDRARVVHPTPDPRVVPVRARLRDAGIRAALAVRPSSG